MANPYTQATQSQFVPTYQSLPVEQIAQGAMQRQKQHEQNLARADALKMQQRVIKQNVLSEDEPVVDERLSQVRGQLDEIAQQGDLSDADKQLRQVATQFQDEVLSGDVGKAMENFQTAQEQIQRIEESDLPQTIKERKKNAIMKGYEGVEKGGLDTNITEDWTNIEQYAQDNLSDMNTNQITSFLSSPQGQNLSQEEKQQLQQYGQGEISIEQVPTSAAKQVLSSKVTNDPEARSGLMQRARLETADMDEYTVDGEEVSRERKMQQLVNQYVDTAAENFAGKSRSMDIDMTAGQDPTEGTSGFGSTTYTRGTTKVTEWGVNDIGSALNDIKLAEAAGNEKQANLLRDKIDVAAAQFVQDTDWTEEDLKEAMKVGEEFEKEFNKITGDSGKSSPGGVFAPLWQEATDTSDAGIPTGEGGDPTDAYTEAANEVGEEKARKYQNFKEDMNSWLDKKGGVTEVGYDITGDQSLKRVKTIMQSSSPAAWTIHGSSDIESREMLGKKLEDAEGYSLNTFQPQHVLEGQEGIPTRIQGTIEKNGEQHQVQLAYKRPPNLSSDMKDPMDRILESTPGAGEFLKEKRRVEHIRPSLDYNNVFNELPSNLRQTASSKGNSYVGLQKGDRGVNVSVGADEDTSKPITQADILANIHKWTGVNNSANVVLESLDQNDILNQKEKEFILNGGLKSDDLTEEEQQTKTSVSRKISRAFDKPYEFPSVYMATKAAANTSK